MGSGHVRYAHLMEIVALFSILHAQLNPSCQFQLTKYDELKNHSCPFQLTKYVELNPSCQSQLTK